MNIEQYFGGRIRYIQVGDNGNSRPGVGCYAKSPGISGQDVIEIQKRFKQYLSTEQNDKGVKPTIYKRLLLPTGTILMTACSYIPSPQGKNGPIDRPDWIDHSYLINGADPAALNPEQWLGLSYRTDDPNPTWEVIPPQIAERIKNGEVYRSEKWITAASLDRLPASGFQLLSLPDVLELWELEDLEMIDLVEAALDCVAAPDLGGRKLFIKYDINAEDCLDNRYWDRSKMDAESFNRFRMEQLLAWIYHLIPFSFRRLLGFDTTLDANAGYHHIIFVPENRIRVTADRQYGYMFPAYDGTNLSENTNIMMTGGGYFYDHERGIWHNAAAGNKDYRELYQTDGIIQKLITEEVSRYMKAGSMEETRRLIKEYYDFFGKLEKHIPIYSDSIAELESEIPRWKASLVADPEELKGMAVTLLGRKGNEDIAVNEGNYEYFMSVMSALESRITTDNKAALWTPVLEHAVTRPAFKDQMSCVRELTNVILSEPNPLESYYKYEEREDFKNTTVNGEKLLDWIFAGLCENSECRAAWLREQYGEAGEYTGRLRAFDYVKQQFGSLERVTQTEKLHAANTAYYRSLPLLTDTANVTGILTIDGGALSDEAHRLAADTAGELLTGYQSLEICRQVAQKGPEAYRSFCRSVASPTFDSAKVLCDRLLETVFGEWIRQFGSRRISPEELSSVIDLLNENRQDKRFDKWSMSVIEITGMRGENNGSSLFEGFTAAEFESYLKKVTGTDETMLKSLCRYQLFTAAAVAIMKGTVSARREDVRSLSEYLTTESQSASGGRHGDWLMSRIDAGAASLIEILAGQIRANRSLSFTAPLFTSLRDDNVLNRRQTLEALLPEARNIIGEISSSGKAGEKDLMEFEQTFRWWSTDPEVRAERRKIVRAANYMPSFSEISEALETGSRAGYEKLSDNGFIYDSERYRVTDAGSLLRAMSRKPEEMSTAEWIGSYCSWIEEGLRKQDLGKTMADYKLLDVMSDVILREGVSDMSPGARVDQKWLSSLETDGVKPEKLEKKGIHALALFTLIGVKDVCEQLTAARAKKVNVDNPSVNGVIERLIGNGKVNIRFNDRTWEAVCAYVKEQPNFFSQILYNWRADRIVKLMQMLRENLNEQELKLYQGLFDRNRIELNRIYTDTEMDAFRKTLGISDRAPGRPGGGSRGTRPAERSRAADRRNDAASQAANRGRQVQRGQSVQQGRPSGNGQPVERSKKVRKNRPDY